MTIIGEDVDRIASLITDWSNPAELKEALQNRFPKWKDLSGGGRNRFETFTQKILDRTRWYDSEEGILHVKLQDRIGISGPKGHRLEMLTDINGKYLGRPSNVKTYKRHGKVFGLNNNTGRRARIA